MSIIDKYRFEHDSGIGCSNSDYLLHRTSCCGSFCVEDYELSNLYLDPNDLHKTVSLLGASGDDSPWPCPFCGAKEWDLCEVQELRDVPDCWKWACSER